MLFFCHLCWRKKNIHKPSKFLAGNLANILLLCKVAAEALDSSVHTPTAAHYDCSVYRSSSPAGVGASALCTRAHQRLQEETHWGFPCLNRQLMQVSTELYGMLLYKHRHTPFCKACYGLCGWGFLMTHCSNTEEKLGGRKRGIFHIPYRPSKMFPFPFIAQCFLFPASPRLV